jgi:hypothetical protein
MHGTIRWRGVQFDLRDGNDGFIELEHGRLVRVLLHELDGVEVDGFPDGEWQRGDQLLWRGD